MSLISNDTQTRSKIWNSYVYWDGLFTDDQIDKIIEYGDMHKPERGFISDKTGNLSEDFNVRKSNVGFHHKNEDNSWIFDNLNKVIEHLNDAYYNFDLWGYDYFQYTTYSDTEKGHYNWHIDTFLGPAARNQDRTFFRKLSLVMLLNTPGKDFEGGEFEMDSDQRVSVPLTKGKIILFPSFFKHKVNEVTKGVRKSLVIWVEGPKFR
jgi:PKHD-type hydroxylase